MWADAQRDGRPAEYYISDLHSKFALRPYRVEVWQTSNLRRRRLGEEEKRTRKKKQDENIMSASAMQGGHNKEAKTTY